MNPILQTVWRFGIAGLALAAVLGQIDTLPWPQGWPSLPLILASLSAISIILSWGLNRMWFFAPIRVSTADVFIDTLLLRKIIHGTEIAPKDAFLDVTIEFTLLWGSGGVRDEIEIQWPSEIASELNPLVSTSKQVRTIRLKPTTTQGITELKLGIPQSFSGSQRMPVKVQTYNKQLVDKLDALSERIQNGRFKIIWKTALGEERTYNPKRIK